MHFGQAAPAVEETFRRARGLLTADALEAWLAGWSIEPDDFRRWTEDPRTATPWCALVCSGELEAATAEVATAVAAARELGEPVTSASTFDPAGMVDRLVAEQLTDDALAAAVATHRLGWTRLSVVVAQAPRRGVAEELRHQVLDGGDLTTCATAARCAVRAGSDVLDAVGPALRPALAGARAGEVVGPVPTGDGWALAHVTARTEPTLTDDLTRERATASVRGAVIAAALGRHVVA